MTAVACSRDGKYVASAIEEKVIGVRDMESRKIVHRLPTAGPVASVVFSPDGKLLAVAESSGAVILWDTSTGKPHDPQPKILHQNRATTVLFSPDGTMLVTAAGDGIFKLWEVLSGGMIREFKAGDGAVTALAWAPGSQRITSATASPDVSLKLWDANAGKLLGQADGYHAEISLLSPTWSPDGHWLAVRNQDGAIAVLPAELNTLPRILPKPPNANLVDLTWFPRGDLLVAIDTIGPAVILIDAQTGAVVRSIAKPTEVHAQWTDVQLDWSPDGSQVAICYGPSCKEVYLVEVGTGKLVRKLESPGKGVCSVAYAPDGKALAGADREVAWWWNLDSGKAEVKYSWADVGGFQSVTWSSDGKLVALGTTWGCLLAKRSGEGFRWLGWTGATDALNQHFVDKDRVFVATKQFAAFAWDVATSRRIESACVLVALDVSFHQSFVRRRTLSRRPMGHVDLERQHRAFRRAAHGPASGGVSAIGNWPKRRFGLQRSRTLPCGRRPQRRDRLRRPDRRRPGNPHARGVLQAVRMEERSGESCSGADHRSTRSEDARGAGQTGRRAHTRDCRAQDRSRADRDQAGRADQRQGTDHPAGSGARRTGMDD